MLNKNIMKHKNGSFRVAVYGDCYDHRLGYLRELAAVLIADYPELGEAVINIEIYGGRFRSGTWAAEAMVTHVHPDYDMRENLEPTR